MRQKSGPREATGRRSNQGHPTRDASTLFGRGEDPHRAGRAARRGKHCRTLSPQGHRLVDVLWLVERVPRGRQKAARGRHSARYDLRRGEGPSPGGAGSERGGRGGTSERRAIGDGAHQTMATAVFSSAAQSISSASPGISGTVMKPSMIGSSLCFLSPLMCSVESTSCS
jgi:hypothetical protein